MAKGSQLSQLKSALSQAGFTGNQNQGKKRKRPISVEKDKAKKAAKLEEIHRRLNPFDVKVTKLKHDVGGRKVKGVTGKPAQSRQAGIEKRRKTLLNEFKDKDRAGGIVDRRFGENDPTMSIEERMLERFTRERQRASKGIAFNLEDEDELTHYGQSLSKLDDFDNVGLDLEDEEDEDETGKIDGNVVKSAHFGGFEEEDDESEEPARKKSKGEVMAEVIAKSKEHKMLRQMEKEKEENVRHELDQDFDALRSLLFASAPSASQSSSGQPQDLTVINDTGDADYDAHVRELAFDRRAKPKDRTKTEEEIALEEKEALEKAEKQRQKRMMGIEESESDDEGHRRKRRRGGDDLEDDFGGFGDEDDWGGLGAGLEELGAQDGEQSASEAGSLSDEEDGEEDGGEDFDTGDSDEESEVEGDLEEIGPSSKTNNTTQRPANPKSASKELPFTFPCPNDHEEFLSSIEDIEDHDIPTVIKRIRTLYHPSLSPDNKLRLQTLTNVLIDHVLFIASPPEPRFTLLSAILPHLNELIKSYPVSSAEYLVQKLSIMHKNLKRGLSKGPLDPDSKTWPSLPELSLLRLIGTVWSTSDLNHAVVSPARVLMAAYLGLGRTRSLSDVTSGLFLCTTFLQFEALSKRLVPEAINFLINAVLHLAPHNYERLNDAPGSFPSPDFQSDSCRTLRITSKGANLSPQKANLSALLQADPTSEQAKINLLSLTLELLRKFAEMYKGLDGFIELYEPICEILENLKTEYLSDPLKTSIAKTNDVLQRLLKFAKQSRHPLLLQAHKPIPIPTYIPKFEMGSSSYLRHQDPDRERNEAAKLRHQYKQERKGAIRELRKDAKFLAGIEQEKQREKDRTYHARMKRVFGSIEVERAEEKAMEREKTKAKKRAGRK